MKIRILLFLWFVAAGLLSACGGTLEVAFDTTPTPDLAQAATVQALQTRVATLEPLFRPLDLNSSPDEIRQALLNSHLSWQTLFIEAQTSAYDAGAGEPHVERVQVWVDQPRRAYRVLRGPLDQPPQVVELSDGTNKELISVPDWRVSVGPLSEAALVSGWSPPRQPTDAIQPHPLDLEMETVLGEMIFSTALGQREGTLTALGMEKVAGRPVLVVEYSREDRSGDRAWIDTRTGLVLRWQGFDKTGGGVSADFAVQSIEYDLSLPADLFDLRLSEPPQFARDASGAPLPTPLPPAAEFRPGEGELYFVIERSPDPLQLVRLPEGCATGSEDCPAPQPVEGYPNQNNTVEPLVWSPDRSMAALVHQGALYHFTAGSGEWQTLAQFPMVESPVWSPDGRRIAFLAYSAEGRQSIWVVGADGTGLLDLTAQTGAAFEGLDLRLWPAGWLDDGRLLFLAIDVRTATLYAQAPDGNGFAPLDSPALPGGLVQVSPDGRQLAFSTTENDAAAIFLAPVEGGRIGEPRRLATFQDASLQQLLWSPDGEQIAFMTLAGGMADTQTTTVYAMRTGGADLHQLFQERSIQRLAFSPSGQHLVAEGIDNGRLAVIPVEGGKARLLDAPGLRLDQRQMGASWR